MYNLKFIHMKKVVVIICLFVAGMTVNAQFYMGGSAGFNIKTTDYDGNRDSRTILDFTLYPELGFFLNERLSIGAELGLGIHSDSDYDDATVNILFNPYARWSLFQAGKFEVLGKASLNTFRKKDYFYFGLHVDPVLAYNVSDKIVLQATLNFLNLRCYYLSNTDNSTTVNFGFGADTNNLATLGALKVGFIYKF